MGAYFSRMRESMASSFSDQRPFLALHNGSFRGVIKREVRLTDVLSFAGFEILVPSAKSRKLSSWPNPLVQARTSSLNQLALPRNVTT